MSSFPKNGSISDLQGFIREIYGVPDDRLYSIWDLLTQQQRFAMRSLKGIRKGNKLKLKTNLLISLSWSLAIANRLHIDMEDEVWKRFPYLCSYCGRLPCSCKALKAGKRAKIRIDDRKRPSTLHSFQEMFGKIYPPKVRTLADAGVHLAEEMGEVAEAIHNYLGQHQEKQFHEVRIELADFVSCTMGVANSAGIDLAKELALQYANNCHVCHSKPCVCKFSVVVSLKS